MHKALTLILALSLFSLVGCDNGGGSTPPAGGGNGGDATPTPDTPEAGGAVDPASRAAFIGTWKGKYSGLDDTMIIEAGEGELDVMVTLHSTFENPDKVPGKLTANDTVTIIDQQLGGMKGSAVITIADGKLALVQKGGGATVKGEGYEKQ